MTPRDVEDGVVYDSARLTAEARPGGVSTPLGSGMGISSSDMARSLVADR